MGGALGRGTLTAKSGRSTVAASCEGGGAGTSGVLFI
jgi:hypothetical protein